MLTSETNGHVHEIPLETGGTALTMYFYHSGSTNTLYVNGGPYTAYINGQQDEHTHDVADHTHPITYGIYEYDITPTITAYTNNTTSLTSGFTSRYSSTADQLDYNFTSYFTGTGWKSIRLNTTGL